jgi:transposase-like protein
VLQAWSDLAPAVLDLVRKAGDPARRVYGSDWTIKQLIAHLVSGLEVYSDILRGKGSPVTSPRFADLVLSSQGLSGPRIAERVGCTEPTVVLWRRRYAEEGLGGLDERPRPPPATTMTDAVRDEILTVTLTRPPAELGITHWSSRLLVLVASGRIGPLRPLLRGQMVAYGRRPWLAMRFPTLLHKP